PQRKCIPPSSTPKLLHPITCILELKDAISVGRERMLTKPNQPPTTRPVRYRTCLAVAATLAIDGLVGLPTRILAQFLVFSALISAPLPLCGGVYTLFDTGFTGLGRLHAQQVRLNPVVALVAGPDVQRERRNVVHRGHHLGVPSHVHAQQVAVTVSASLDADVRKLRRRVDREVIEALFAARRAQDAPELPLPTAQRAHQRSPRTLVLLPKHGHHRSAPAAGTQRDGIGDGPGRFGADSLGVGSQEGPGEKLI